MNKLQYTVTLTFIADPAKGNIIQDTLEELEEIGTIVAIKAKGIRVPASTVHTDSE